MGKSTMNSISHGKIHGSMENPMENPMQNPMENPNGKIHHESSGFSHHVPGMGLNHLRSCSFGLCLWTAEDHRTWELPAGLAMEVSFAGGFVSTHFPGFSSTSCLMTPEGECRKHPATTSRGPATDTKTHRNGILFCCLRRHVLW